MAAQKRAPREVTPEFETVHRVPVSFGEALGAVRLKSFEKDGRKGYYVQVYRAATSRSKEASVSLGGNPEDLDAVCVAIQEAKKQLLARRK